MSAAIQAGIGAVSKLEAKTGRSQAQIMREVRMIGGAMIGIAVLVVVLNEVFSLDTIATGPNGSYTGPFGDVLGSLETTGAAALGLLVIGLLVLGANRVMGFFGGGGF